MIHYLLHDAQGNIVQRGQCSYEDNIPQIDGLTTEVIEADDHRNPIQGTHETYADFRRYAYPNIGDQLDAIWKILDGAGLLSADPQVKAIHDKVNAVKARFPKK